MGLEIKKRGPDSNQDRVASSLWRRQPDSNRRSGFCKPVPYRLAMAPRLHVSGHRFSQCPDARLYHAAPVVFALPAQDFDRRATGISPILTLPQPTLRTRRSAGQPVIRPVSYTHLTLPTIYSV